MFKIFQEPRANARLYDKFYAIEDGVVNYVMYSKLDQCEFEPDLIMLAAKPSQAEIILRAMSYSTGEIWDPKATLVLGCSWLYAYPCKSGKVNYVFTGMHFGMKARKAMPEGYVLMSIPFDWITIIVKNLNEMEWVLPAWTYSKEEWLKVEAKAYADLAADAADPEKGYPKDRE